MDTTTFYSAIIPAHHKKANTLRQAPYSYALSKHTILKTGKPITLTMKSAHVNKLISYKYLDKSNTIHQATFMAAITDHC
jgi:hypothetical protein